MEASRYGVSNVVPKSHASWNMLQLDLTPRFGLRFCDALNPATPTKRLRPLLSVYLPHITRAAWVTLSLCIASISTYMRNWPWISLVANCAVCGLLFPLFFPQWSPVKLLHLQHIAITHGRFCRTMAMLHHEESALEHLRHGLVNHTSYNEWFKSKNIKIC